MADEKKSSTKRQTRSKEILISAARTFRGHGFATASMAQIAKDLGMRKSNLYYYFRSKEEILFASHIHLMEALFELATEIEAAGGDPKQKIRSLTEGFIYIIVDEFHASALTHNIRGMTPEHQQQVIQMRDRFERYYRSWIEQGIEQGIFRAMNVKLVGFAIFGAMNWIHRWHNRTGACDSATIAKEFADFVLAGLQH